MQIKILSTLILISGLLAPLSIALSEEPSEPPAIKTSDIENSRGQLLYETHCAACHDQSVHNRKPRKADSIGKIKYWVTRWSTELKLSWSSSDIDAVAQYLNSKYYKFKE